MHKEEFRLVDLFKFIFAVCVVFRHTDVIENSAIDKYISPLVFRLAVPYFFVASGFFIGKKYLIGPQGNPSFNPKNYILRILKKLVVFELVNTLLFLIQRILMGENFNLICLRIFRYILFYPDGALWYLQAVIIALFLLIPTIRGGIGMCFF